MNNSAEWVIVIGGSAGALTALREVLTPLPAGLPAACCVVIHTSSSGGQHLPSLMRRWTSWSVSTVQGPEELMAGHVYVSGPDRHLKVTPGGIETTREPREHHTRPAIDPLFRSAARIFGPRTIAVVLSGYGGDGAAGVIAVHSRRGTVVAQEPADAEVPSMPRRAIETGYVTMVVPGREIAATIGRIMSRVEVAAGGREMPLEDEVKRQIAHDIHEQERGGRNGKTALVTCPDCGGTMWQTDEGSFVDFSCHIGHRYSADTLMVEKTEHLEAALGTALRLLKEKAMLLRHSATRARANGNERAAERLDEQASVDERYAGVLQRELLEAEPSALSNAMIEEETPIGEDGTS